MKNGKDVKNGVVAFFKHNGYYLIMAACLIAIIVMVSVAIAGVNKAPVDEPTLKPDTPVIPSVPDEPVVVEPDMNFILPVSGANIVNGFSEENSLYYNPILDQYSFHSGIDFQTQGKAEVVSVLDGEVISASNHKMYGNVVEVKHANNIVSIYRSLADLKVKKGDKIKKGDTIGYTSSSDISESNFGEHLHFEMTENGKTINPNKYLVYDEK